MCVPRDFYERNCWIPCLIRVASALDEHRRHNVVAAANILQDLVEQVAFADARGLPVPEVMVGVANWLAVGVCREAMAPRAEVVADGAEGLQEAWRLLS
jgi:hypothetical protein